MIRQRIKKNSVFECCLRFSDVWVWVLVAAYWKNSSCAVTICEKDQKSRSETVSGFAGWIEEYLLFVIVLLMKV